MSLISRLGHVLAEATAEYEALAAADFEAVEQIGSGENLLALGDNARFMKHLLTDKNMKGSMQMIYIDPPFFSKANYDAVVEIQPEEEGQTKRVKRRAYQDVWEQGMEDYLKMMAVRLMLMRDLLKDEGTIWVHLDWHSAHYVKIFLDEIFGDQNFINEIVWQYKSGGSSKRHFARKHDTILVYGKTQKYYLDLPQEKSYNRGFKPYRFKGVEEFCDERGWYTMVKMKDVWTIDMVGRTSAERTGYATQKPEALLRRIIEAASREGDLVCDFFAGSATLAAAAGKLDRRWICCDNGALAVNNAICRLQKQGQSLTVLNEEGNLEGQPSYECGTDDCRIVLENFVTKTLFPDKIYFTIQLKNYILKELTDSMRASAKKELSRIADENPLALVDYWSVDLHYDGQLFRPEAGVFREKGKTAVSLEIECSPDDAMDYNVMVKVADIFGNVTFVEIGDICEMVL